MKSFIIVEDIVKNGVLQEENINYVPAFAGIFIDLDKAVDIDNCDQYVGVTGLGCEYYLKGGQISKLFLEMSLNYHPEIISENVAEVIKNQLKGEIIGHQVASFKNAQCFNPKKILLNEDFNIIQFFFPELKVGKSLEQQIESLKYLKVSRNVAFGLTEKNELAAIIVTDFAKKIYYNDIILEKAIDGNSHRFESFVQLNQQFYDINIDEERFGTLVHKYLNTFNLSSERLNGSSTDVSILAHLELEKKGQHRLRKK